MKFIMIEDSDRMRLAIALMAANIVVQELSASNHYSSDEGNNACFRIGWLSGDFFNVRS